MKKALIVIILATIVGIGLRYIFPKEAVVAKQKTVHIDEFLAQTLNEVEKDTPSKKDTIAIKKVAPKHTIETIKKEEKNPVQSSVSTHFLANFFEKLSKLERTKKGQLRIAYFGDSMLDADMIVMQFRHYLQKRFGGQGVGFVPITSASASGRYSIKHSFSYNWKKQSFLKRCDTIFPFGINGETFFVGDSLSQEKATVTYRKGSAYRELGLVRPNLWYGKRKENTSEDSEILPPSAILRTEEGEEIQLDISKNRLLNSVALPSWKKSLEIEVSDQATVPFYGVTFNSANGIIVDNLAVRGNSGLTLTRLRMHLMRQFQRQFGYDLVILSYGTNVFTPDYEKSYGWYGKRMRRVVAHLQNCFRGADFIVVSMADRAVKEDDEMHTPESLADFIQVEKGIADSTKSAFYNLYAAMGGTGSMQEWVESEPPLANKDYTHFNSKGAEKVGRMFYNWLMSNYEQYLKEKKKTEVQIKDTLDSSKNKEI